MMNRTVLEDLIPPAESLDHLDLDELRQQLREASELWETLEGKARLYEAELQRELRAKVDLCGGTPSCPTPEIAFTLSGSALLAARREASQEFNRVFFMAPLSRNAQKPSRLAASF